MNHELDSIAAVLRKAFQVEVDGFTFYSMAAERAAKPATQKLFTRLARDETELGSQLEQAAQTIESAPTTEFSLPNGCAYGTGDAASSDQTAFVFPGQGSQYLHMGAELAILVLILEE